MADDSTTTTDPTDAQSDPEAEAPEPESPQPGPEAAPAPAELEAGPRVPAPVRDRLLLPLLLPIGAIAAVALYVLNISRVFLAGGNGAASVVAAVLVTVGILAGAAAISASPRLRSSTLTMTISVLMIVVVSAGLVTLGPSEDHEGGEAGGYQQPEGAPTATLEVVAGPGTSFQADQFTAAGGILEITYVDEGAAHTLLFDDPAYQGFKLAVPDGPAKGKVEIAEGEYVIYCDIPGHRDGGMEATLVVGPGAPPPSEGTPPTTAAP